MLKERSPGFGGYGGSDPPVPIPNTEVKPACADGTWVVGPRESRSPPDIIRLRPPRFGAASIASATERAGCIGMADSKDKKRPSRREPGSRAADDGGRGPGRRPLRKGPGRAGSRADPEGETNKGWSRKSDGPALHGNARDLPRWVVEALARVTPSDRAPAALEALGDAADAFGDGRFDLAARYSHKAKDLSPRDANIREMLGLSSYRIGDWPTALRELRTYRRLAGETTHLPIEMDVLRAMDRPLDVERAFREIDRLGAGSDVQKEGRVIYASFLLDQGRVGEARRIATPSSLSNDPYPEDLRLWYVAARCAALDGDPEAAVEYRDALLIMDPAFPGMNELDRAIAGSGEG